MKAYDRRKLLRQWWSKQMKKGLTNSPDGSWGSSNSNMTTTGHNQKGSSHNK